MSPRAAKDPVSRRAARNAEVGPTVAVSIDGGHCHLYGICEAEAPEVFRLVGGRLLYRAKPGPDQVDGVRSAARLCPMQAIHLRERT